MIDKSSKAPNDKSWEIQLVQMIAEFLKEEDYRFHYLADECIELYLQGKHLTMRFLIYAHNRHLVVRVPGFIRNIELRRTDVLLALMSFMNDFFDIRFELAEDGQSLSASCNHIVEDGRITAKQFSQLMMVVAYLVDEAYPKLMQIIFGQAASLDVHAPQEAAPEPDPDLAMDHIPDEDEEDDEEEESEESEDYELPGVPRNDGPKIN